jgi:hypothetical protein
VHRVNVLDTANTNLTPEAAMHIVPSVHVV